MNVQIRPVDVSIKNGTKQFMSKKLAKLEQYYDRIIDVVAWAKEEANGGKEEKVVDVKILVPGNLIIASGAADTFESATEKSVQIAKRNLKRYKEKRRAR